MVLPPNYSSCLILHALGWAVAPAWWRSRATLTQRPLMGEQVLDRVQWSRAEAVFMYQSDWPAPAPLAQGKRTVPSIKHAWAL